MWLTCTSKRLIVGAVTCLIWTVTPTLSSATTATDPCQNLISFNGDQSVWKSRFEQYVSDIWHVISGSSPPRFSEPQKLYYTIRHGFSVTPDCRGSLRWRTSIAYPVGLVVRPIGTFATNNKYALVEAEHGLRLYISQRDLTELRKDVTYFFANSMTEKKSYCKDRSKCEYKNHNHQTDLEKKLTSASMYIWPQGKYLISEESYTDCAVIEVKVALRKNVGDGKYYFNPCTIDQKSQKLTFDSRVKAVDFRSYQKRFTVGISGYYQRFPPSLIKRLQHGYTTVKQCNQKIEIGDTIKVGVKGNFELKLLIAELVAGGSYELVKKSVSSREVGDFSFYSSYAIFLPNKTVTQWHVEAYSVCDKRKRFPQNPYEFAIYHNSFDIDKLSFADIGESVKEKIRGLNAGKLRGWTPSGKHTWLMKGVFWKMCGLDQYFQWKHILSQEIADMKEVDKLLEFKNVPQSLRAVSEERAIQFFTHLMLAAVVDWRTTC